MAWENTERGDVPLQTTGSGVHLIHLHGCRRGEASEKRRIFRAFALLVVLFGLLCSKAAPAAGAQYVYDAGGRLVQVIAPDGSSAQYQYDPAGNILGITRLASSSLAETGTSVVSGSVGSTLTIYGSGFSTIASNNQVWINGVLCTVVSSTANSITVTVPAGATTGAIKITVNGNTVVSSANFLVAGATAAPTISSLSPQIASAGSSVTIAGTGFQATAANNKVYFGHAVASVASATSTSIVATVPAGYPSGKVTVSTANGNATSTQDFFVPPSGRSASDVVATGRMTIGSSFTATIGTAGKIAMILFDGNRNQRVGLQVPARTFQSACQNGSVTLFGPSPSTNTLASVDLCGGSTFYTLTASGTYTLVLTPSSSADTGNATVSLLSVQPNAPTAIPVNGTATTMTISNPGQFADFTFSGTAGQKVSVKTSNNALSQLFDFSIISPSNAVLTSITGTNATYFGPFTLPTTGTYTLRIVPQKGGTGSLSLQLYTFSDISGTFSGSDAAATYTINAPGQGIVFTYNGTAGQRVSLLISNSTLSGSTSYYDVTFLNPDRTTLNTRPAANGSFSGPFTLTQTGTYTVKIIPQQGGTGNVTLQFYNVPADQSGTFSGTAPATTLSIGTPGQAISYTYSGTAGQRVSLSISNSTLSGSTSYYDVIFLNPDGSTLSSRSAVNASFIGPFTLTQTGTYTIKVVPQQGGTGNVTLQFYNIPADQSGTFSGTASATTLSIGTPGQAISYTYSGTAGQRISLSISNSTLSGLTNWYDVIFLNPDGSTLSSRSAVNASFTGPITLTQTGTHTIKVVPQQGGTGNVTLQFYNIPADQSGTFSGTAPATTLSIGTPGQAISYTYSGTAGQRISLSISNSTLSGLTSWYDVVFLNPDGSTLNSRSAINASFTGPFTLAQTGTYTIKVVPQQGGTGSMTLQFYNVPPEVSGTLTTGVAATVTIGTPGQGIAYTYAGTSGQGVTLQISNSTLAGITPWYDVTILNPDGTTLKSFSGVNSSSSGALSLSQTGTYTIKIVPQQGGTGSLTAALQ